MARANYTDFATLFEMIECLTFSQKSLFFKLTHCFKVASGLSKEINKKLIRPLLGVASEIDFRPEILSARVNGF